MRKLTAFLFVVAALGCARVNVQAPKEPIKVDISMRLDVYQHIQKDIDAIENLVSGAADEPSGSNGRSLLNYALPLAYADEGLSPQVEQAAMRRKQRLGELNNLEKRAVIGENRFGLLEVRNAAAATEAVRELVEKENQDRLLIYQEVAKKNNSSLEEVKKLYAARLQKDAPAGTPIEVKDASGAYVWKIKE